MIYCDSYIQIINISCDESIGLQGVEAVKSTTANHIPAEVSSPTTDWSLSWKLFRLSGLASNLSSFKFKLLHCLLATKKRSGARIHCKYNNETGLSILSIVKNQVPDINAASLIRLELNSLHEDSELSVMTFVSALLANIWERHHLQNKISLFETRAT